MQDVSGYGLKIRLIASKTFPAGISLSQFADDSDPFDLPDMQIGDTAMGLNGDQVTWSKANPIKTTVGVIPGSQDDKNLSTLFQLNRPGKGKAPIKDIITVVAVYPNGSTLSLINGIITTGQPGKSVASSGRIKSRTYGFSFENLVETLGK